MNALTHPATATPVLTELQVVPVAGRDSMLFNLSGAHGPYFTRNIVRRRCTRAWVSARATTPSPCST